MLHRAFRTRRSSELSLQLRAARQLFLGERRRELATFPFDRVQSHWIPAFAGMTASMSAVRLWGGARAGTHSCANTFSRSASRFASSFFSAASSFTRSEERRVGKECVGKCRSRLWTEH